MTTRTLSIMVADLVGSTLHATSGDSVRGAKFLEDATRPIRTAIASQNGNEIKFTGDGFIATFESARDALICADAIRDHYIRQQYAPGGYVIDGVRVVVHTGDVVLEDGDIIGDPIIVCSRVEKSVPTNQVWVTTATREVVGISDFVFQHVGDIQLRGRALPVTVYSLENTELSFIEHGSVLLVTDLHHYKSVSEELSPVLLNTWLSQWVDLHRSAVHGLRGHIRQFVADLALITFNNGDEALKAALHLQKLVEKHNIKRTELPAYAFKGAIGTGDLILSSNGVVGKLVNDTFDLLNATPRETICLDEGTFGQLQMTDPSLLQTIDLPLGKYGNPKACYRLVPMIKE